MSEQKIDDIIESYDNEKNSELLRELEKLKPKPFASITSTVSLVFVLLIFQYFAGFDMFKGDNYILVMLIIVISGAGVAERVQINKRIDLLVKFIKNNTLQQRNT